MSGEHPFPAKLVSPAKCNEKPWDSWVGELGRVSPRPDDDHFAAPADSKGGASRRAPYKRGGRYRRAGLHRLRHDAMSLHGLFPQLDDLNAAVCHLCGAVVKCSAAYRHLVEAHAGAEPLPPPPPPTKSRSRHKKEQPPPSPAEPLPVKREPSPALLAPPPLARLSLPPPPELQYVEDATATPGEVQVCVESGELPVVSIQDTEELPLGENLTDDIFAIMNSEGIQTADDIANSTDWKNIIRDIGNLQDINFATAADSAPAAELYAPALHTPLSTYSLPEAELSLQLAGATPPPAPEPAAAAPRPSPAARATPRSKTSKTKFNLREYDPNKHCGVVTAENPKPCTRSLTCKAHALSLRRLVEGRAKPFDALLAEHRALRDAGTTSAAAPAPAPVVAAAPAPLPPLLVPAALELAAFNGLTAEQQVDDIYASLLSVEEPALADAASLSSLLSQPLEFVVAAPGAAEEARSPPPPRPQEPPARPAPPDVCWYAACPRPLALCTYNASHAGGAVTLGKRYATVRSNIKSALSRSCKTSQGDFYYGPNALALSKSVHMNASKSNKPEVRKLIVTCSEGREVQQTLSELFGGEVRHGLNGHVSKARALKHAPTPTSLELGFLDPLLADDKC